MTTIQTIDIRDVIAKHQGHWFDADTMRFFKTRLPSVAYQVGDRVLFVTSEKGPNGIRLCTIREQLEDGSIRTVGDFQAYYTRLQAFRALKKTGEAND